MSKQLHEDQLRRMTAMFVENVSSNETIAAAIGIANSSVSRYRRTFKGKIPMPPHVGYLLKRYDLLKLYTPYVYSEAMNVDGIDVSGAETLDAFRLAEINEANRRSGLPAWESDAQAVLEKIDPQISDPIAGAINKLEAERTRLSLAIETLKRLR